MLKTMITRNLKLNISDGFPLIFRIMSLRKVFPTTVVVNNSIGRPFVYPHQSYEHPFVHDFYNGITKRRSREKNK